MSIRLRLLILASRLFVKPAVARAAEPAVLRAKFERLGPKAFRLPPYCLYLASALGPGVPAAAISVRPGACPPQRGRVFLWFHGGAFIMGSSRTHAGLLARISALTRLEVIAPDYRLAPEHPFPAALDDARAAFDALVARGYAPKDIVLGGDSAGGNLAFSLFAALLRDQIRPAGLVALSPVTDLTFSGASVTENIGRDPLLPGDRREDAKRFYLGGADPADPGASPLFAVFPDPPPVFLQFSTTEILRDDCRRIAERLQAEGGRVVTDEWPDAPHVFAMFHDFVPESRTALKRLAGFVDGLWEERPETVRDAAGEGGR